MGYNKSRRPILAPVDNVPTEVGGGGLADFTADEADTGGTWTDGKPIYQKTVAITGTLTGGATNSTAHGISDLGTVVQVFGGCNDGEAGASKDWYPLPLVSGSANVGVQVQLTSVNINITPGSFWNRSTGGTELNDAHITIRYTKTTD